MRQLFRFISQYILNYRHKTYPRSMTHSLHIFHYEGNILPIKQYCTLSATIHVQADSIASRSRHQAARILLMKIGPLD